MTVASTLRYSQFLVKIANDSSPQSFVAPCGLNSRGFQRTANMAETNVPPCPPDEDDPSWIERDTISLSWELSGSGVVDDAGGDGDFDIWDNWWMDQTTKSVQITCGSRQWTGPAKCQNLNVTGERGQRVSMEVTIVSDGVLTRTI